MSYLTYRFNTPVTTRLSSTGEKRRRPPKRSPPLERLAVLRHFLIVIHTVFTLPSESVAFSSHVPTENPVFVLML